MNKNIKFSIIIPAYNEEKRIITTLKDYSDFLEDNKVNYEIIVVADGCTDNTEEKVKEFIKKNKKVSVYTPSKRLGKGGGVYYGFSKAKGDIISFTDADNSIVPEEFYKLIKHIRPKECLICSRRGEGAKILNKNPNKMLIFASRTFNFIVARLIFGLNIKDTQCGAKMLWKHDYERIKKSLYSTGFEFDVELLYRLKKAHVKIKEVPIVWTDHPEESKTRIGNSLNMLKSLLRAKYPKLRKKELKNIK